MRIRFAFVRPSIRPLWSSNPDYATAPARSKNCDALNAEFGAFTEKSPPRPGSGNSTPAGVPCGPIYSIDQMLEDECEDEQVGHLGIAQHAANAENRHIDLVGQPVCSAMAAEIGGSPLVLQRGVTENSRFRD